MGLSYKSWVENNLQLGCATIINLVDINLPVRIRACTYVYAQRAFRCNRKQCIYIYCAGAWSAVRAYVELIKNF
jgi:hypothetical protein